MLSYFSSTIGGVLKDLGLVAGDKRISGTSVGGRVKIDYGDIFVGRGPITYTLQYLIQGEVLIVW